MQQSSSHQLSSASSTSSSPRAPWKKRLTFVTKILFISGLLFFLAKKGFISIQATSQALSQWEKIVPCVIAMFFSTLLGILRWQWLLQAQNIHLPLIRTVQLNLIGSFFNLALPGAVSGDFVKAFYIGKDIPGQRSRAFGSIFFDRLAGLSALVFLSAGAILVGFRSYSDSRLFAGIQTLLVISAVVVFIFYAYLFLIKEHHDPLLHIVRRLEQKSPRFGSITRIYESLRHYHNHKSTVLKVLMLSLLIHIIIGCCCYNLAMAIQPHSLSLLAVFIVVPLGLLVTAVPIAPAGIGTGNVAFLYFFNLIQFIRGADVFSLYALWNIMIGVVGGVIYFRFKSKVPLESAM